MRLSRGYWLAGSLTAAVLSSRLFPAPALIDAATGAPFPGRLEFPRLSVIFTPFCSVADLLSCNGARQDVAFAMMTLVVFAVFRFILLGPSARARHDAAHAVKAFALYAALATGFLVWAFFWPHTPPRLVLEDPDAIAVDFHSYTNASADARRSFTATRSAAWHEQAGFGAGFVTDRGTTDGRGEAQSDDLRRWSAGERAYASLAGEEISLPQAHIAVLGDPGPLPLTKYSDGPSGVADFLSEVRRAPGTAAILTLPDHWRYDASRTLERLADTSALGLEIWASSPLAMELPQARRGEAVELCRRKNLFMAGGTDERGYGTCACVWNVVRLPGWKGLNPAKRQDAILKVLRGGFASVAVAARSHVDPGRGDWVMLDGPRELWLMARAWTGWQCCSAVIWFWLIAWFLAPFNAHPKW